MRIRRSGESRELQVSGRSKSRRPARSERSIRCHPGLLLPVGLLLPLLCVGASAARATPIISEILYDAAGSDDGFGFVELQGAPGTVLDGWTLEGINGSNGAVGPVIELEGVIPEDGLFVVADRTSGGTTFVPGADLLANFDFQNGPDSVELRDGDWLLDAVGYGNFGAGDVFAGEGMAAPDAPAGSSLARTFADVDSDDNALDFEVLAEPTPGEAEFSAVPEPGSGVLLFSALAALAGIRRQRVAPTPWPSAP
jgi:hypothetical protein